MEPMRDKTVVVLWAGAIACPKGILPVSQGTHDTEYGLECHKPNQEQVNDSEVEVADKCPASKVPEPDDRQGPEIKQHHDYMEDQYQIGQAGKQWTHSILESLVRARVISSLICESNNESLHRVYQWSAATKCGRNLFAAPPAFDRPPPEG
jgi:hypothetical protein